MSPEQTVDTRLLVDSTVVAAVHLRRPFQAEMNARYLCRPVVVTEQPTEFLSPLDPSLRADLSFYRND